MTMKVAARSAVSLYVGCAPSGHSWPRERKPRKPHGTARRATDCLATTGRKSTGRVDARARSSATASRERGRRWARRRQTDHHACSSMK
eukprot:281736-Pleurochrysis_carterae.AAC.1